MGDTHRAVLFVDHDKVSGCWLLTNVETFGSVPLPSTACPPWVLDVQDGGPCLVCNKNGEEVHLEADVLTTYVETGPRGGELVYRATASSGESREDFDHFWSGVDHMDAKVVSGGTTDAGDHFVRSTVLPQQWMPLLLEFAGRPHSGGLLHERKEPIRMGPGEIRGVAGHLF